jgi:hypothetical protein
MAALEVSTVQIKSHVETKEALERAGRCALRSLPYWLGNSPSLQWHYLIKQVCRSLSIRCALHTKLKDGMEWRTGIL